MGGRQILFEFLCYLTLMLLLQIQQGTSLNSEGLELLEFRKSVSSDPHGAFSSWNASDPDPCKWCGVRCEDGKVEVLDLSGYSLEGTLTPVLGKLGYLRSLVLCENQFSGFIPAELGKLKMLELLDLRNNNLNGVVPVEIKSMVSLKHLLLEGNQLVDISPSELARLGNPKLARNLVSTSASESDSMTSEFGNWFETGYLEMGGQKLCQTLSMRSSVEPEALHDVIRRILGEYNSNLLSNFINPLPIYDEAILVTASTGAFPALKNHSPQPILWYSNFSDPSPAQTTVESSADEFLEKYWAYFVCGFLLLIIFCAVILSVIRRRAKQPIQSYASGLITTSIPKMKQTELDSICEQYVYILDTLPGCKIYKGTLPSGAHVVVCSTTISSIRDWSECAESAFRKQIRMLSRINHKNFVNLLAYCQEDEPFLRMMVFENAPSGTLYEHLHDNDKHLDWNTRMRIVMGVAYCLQHMHHALHPLVASTCVHSKAVRLSDDYAAKLTEVGFWSDILDKAKIKDKENDRVCDIEPNIDPKSNVYSFGLMLLEIISGKLPVEEVGWAAEYLEDKKKIGYMIDPTLKSFDDTELNILCEVIQECINPDARKRPTMRLVTSKLREALGISEDEASPKLSPVWWKELEILCVEAG